MAGKLTIHALRRQAVLGSLLPPTTLARAIGTAGFVQADPIRAPARAQDLILRHRVAGYRDGDLERRFARLGLEEDFLYAYGFMPRDTVRLLHPRDPGSSGRWQVPGDLAAEVLAFVRDRGPTHPAELAAAIRPRAGGERLGRLLQGDDARAAEPALSRPAAGGRTARRHPDLRGGSSASRTAGARGAQPRRSCCW